MRHVFLASFLCLCGVCYARAQNHSVSVVVSATNPITDITSADLRKVFAGEKRSWPNGAAVKLIVGAPDSHERECLLRLLRMSEPEYKQYWTARVYRGDSYAEPMVLPSVGMIMEAARVFPGLIALLQAPDLKPGMAIKTLRVDGKLPGEAGYPLH